MFSFIPTTLDQSQALFSAYLQSFVGVRDDFWEDHISTSQIYRIAFAGQEIGLAGIHKRENLTLFYLPTDQLRLAQAAFSALLQKLQPIYAFVPTCDELFVSLCMDRCKSIEKQAYFFEHGGKAVRPPEFGRELLRLAVLSDAAVILDTEMVAENIAFGKYYVMYQDGVFLGQGFFNPLVFTPNAASIGMSVHPDHRQKGVGRSIILHLTALCFEQGITPYCGCWYYNHNSKLTLESAGFVTKMRLLKIWLDAAQT